MAAVNNLLQCALRAAKHEEVPAYLEKPKGTATRAKDLEVKIFERYYANLLTYAIRTAEFHAGLNSIPEMEAGLERYAGQMNPVHLLTLYHNIGTLCVYAGQFEQALTWLNRIINYPDSTARPDLYAFARILPLLGHYELGHERLLEYLIKSIYGFLYKRKRLFQFESLLLPMLKKLPYATSSRKLRALFMDFKAQLEILRQPPYERNAFEYFDFLAWLESKISGRPIEAVLASAR